MKLILPLCLVLASCAGLSPEGARVQLADSQPVGSTYVGRVSQGTAGGGAVFSQSSYRRAVDGALSKAGALGATHLVLDSGSRDPRFWGFSQHVGGNAYRAGR